VSISKGYLKKMKSFISSNQHRKWSILEFGARGFIGMMYRTDDLGRLSAFVKMYHWVFPIDILFRHFNDFHLDGNPSWLRRQPPLFRHIGTFSSLHGQVRQLEDIEVTQRIYKDSSNPDANITTSILDHVQNSTISAAYDTIHRGMFWGKNIKKGDYILVKFLKPVRVVKMIVESGGTLSPEDYFGGARISYSKRNCEDYIVWQEFRDVGQLKIQNSNPKGTLCQCLKIEVTELRKDKQGNSRWLAIREIAVWLSS
jgi:alpha-1,3-mannosylglycoprotein beta-1,4-N-acetylglucosaminyltransferase C